MKKYHVNVNGNDYEIAIELIDESEAKAATPVKTAAPISVLAAGEKITSPMPGNILSVNVAAGAAVKKGQILMILEAMKMENEIMSPIDGTIVSIHTAKGATVESGALLCIIK